jgi:hypothetical protein
LKTFGNECKGNVEYTEFSNEVLFKVINKKTEIFIDVFNKNIESLETEVILKELESPLLDQADLNQIISKIQAIKT